MAFKTWASGDILTASDLNAFVVKCQSLYKMVVGTTPYSISATNSTTVTVSYGVTFTTILAVISTIRSGSNIGLLATLMGAPGVSSAAVYVSTPGGGNTTISGDIHWMAVGT